jgi:septal ring factor EnvC (AmiA/AmiB activator)
MKKGNEMKQPNLIKYRIFQRLLFTFILVIAGHNSNIAQNTKENLQKTKKQLEQEIKYTNMLLEQTQKSKQTSLNKLLLINRQIEKREALVEAINSEIDQIEEEIGIQAVQIRHLSDELKKMKDEYAKMIYYANKNLNIFNRIMFIFAAEDFNQAFHRLRYYQQYSSYRRTQAEIIRKTQIELTQKIMDLEETKNQKATLAQSKEQEKNKLIGEKEIKNNAVQELSKKEKQLVATLRDKQENAQKLQREIEKLIAEEIKESAIRAKKTAKAENKPKPEITESKIMLTPVEMELSSSFASNKGKLPWPSEKGIVTGVFGEHAHPVLKYVKVKNNGIDITTDEGANVRSVFNGKVSRVMSFPNMNKVVIVRHGEFLTVYSNLEEVNVTDGQEISTKQLIGKVHTSEDDSKTEYHFEIWLGKTIQNPQEWLSAYH